MPPSRNEMIAAIGEHYSSAYGTAMGEQTVEQFTNAPDDVVIAQYRVVLAHRDDLAAFSAHRSALMIA